MSTAPWMDDTATLLAMGDADQIGGMAHTSVCVVITEGGDTFEVPIIGGNLNFDETRSPRVTANLSTHLLTDQALNDRIDPRRICRVKLAVGYIRPDGLVDVQQIADLGLRSRTRSRPDDTLTLVAASDEALLTDNTVSTSLAVSNATTTGAITDIIHAVLPSATVVVSTSTNGPAVSQSQLDGDKWATILDLSDRMGGWTVYDDGLRVWHIADRPNTYGSPSLSLIDGPGGTLVSVNEDNSRETDWYNRVKVRNEWTDTGGTAHRVVAVADAAGPYAPVAGNVRALEVSRDVPTTSTEAAAAAATLVARTVSRGRVFTVTAPSTYWVRPGHTLVLTETGRDPEQHLVTASDFDLLSGIMTLTTRQPE